MVKVDLITGFLGAGKTTFIRRYLHYLKHCGQKVAIIENEFGPAAVDTMFLREEGGDACEISDLTGLCMCCVGKDEFIYQLKEAAAKGVDRVIVEPSGIYDVDEFFDVMDREDVERVCEIGSILTIADAIEDKRLTEEARYLMFSQLLASGMVILSKVQMVSGGIQQAIEALNGIMREFGCDNGLNVPVCAKDWSELTDADMEAFMSAGFDRVLHDRMLFEHGATFGTVSVKGVFNSKMEMEGKLRRVFRAASCGKIFRVKGIARTADGKYYEVNYTAKNSSVSECTRIKGFLVVIGQDLKEEAVQSILGGNHAAAEV